MKPAPFAASQLEASLADIELAEGVARVRGDDHAAILIPELARLVHFQAHRLAEDLRYGLEARATFDPQAPSPTPAMQPWW